MSLKELLHDRIRHCGYVKANDLKYLVENVWVKDTIDGFEVRYTWRTAIRLLNPTISGDLVKTIYKNGAIVGYEWKTNQPQTLFARGFYL